MTVYFKSVIVVTLMTATFGADIQLPAEFKKCRRNDPKINDCLKVAVSHALKSMRKGVPSLSVPPLEPLHVSSIDIGSGAGPVLITQNYRKIELHGLTESTLTMYKAELNKYRLRTESFTPKMEFLADYIMKGRILVLPIQGKGRANITLANLVVKHDLIGEPKVRDGQTYMHIREYKVKFAPGKVGLHFTNLFNGDKRLGEQMNLFLNQNADLVFNELKDAYEKSLSEVFKDVTNKIFDQVPMNNIFPES